MTIKEKIAKYEYWDIKVFHQQELCLHSIVLTMNGFLKSHNTWIVTRTCSVQFLALILFPLLSRSPGDCQFFVLAPLHAFSFIFPQKKTHNKSPGRFIWKGLINSSKVWTRRTMHVFTVVLSGEIVLKCSNFINEKKNGQGI